MDKKDFRLLLIAGHGDGDPGAAGNGYIESQLTRELIQLIKLEADKKGVSCTVADTSKNYYQYLRQGGIYDFTPYTYVGEIHFNASVTEDIRGDGKMKGSMFYISQSETGHSVEDAILRQMYRIGGVQAWDGVVTAQRQFTGGLLVQERVRAQGVSHGLFETCFISDKDDMDWYQKNKTRIAQAYIAGLEEGYHLTKSDASVPYMVHVAIPDLNIRRGPGVNYESTGYTGVGSFTIVEEKMGRIDSKGVAAKWGRLKSGAGWICLDYTRAIAK